MLDILLQQLANGLVIGTGYALLGAGLALILGILGVLNFAHGEFYMLGAYGVLLAMERLGLGYAPALAVTVVAVVALGAVLKRLVIDPLLKGNAVNTLLGTFALSLLLHYAVSLGVGPAPQRIASPFFDVVELGPVVLTGQKLLVLGAGGAVLVALAVLLQRSSIGRLMRCTSQNRQAARILGVDVRAVENFTFALGMALAAIGGVLLGPLTQITPDMGGSVVLKAFAVIVLGGMGSVPGAIAGGLLLGVAETLAAGYVSTAWRDGLAFFVLLGILLLWPRGMFGVRDAR